mgnify:CR=1 FL=1
MDLFQNLLRPLLITEDTIQSEILLNQEMFVINLQDKVKVKFLVY